MKKRFIVFNHASFASSVLFIEKPNERLRFCVNYRKLNVIIKRNRYLISLIDEVLIKIQDCKYLTRLNIIIAFNKLRMHSNNENFITFITSLKVYKYRVLLFGLTNGSITYQQYMNNIFFWISQWLLSDLFKRYSHLQQDQKRSYQTYSINSSEVTRDRFVSEYPQRWISCSKNKISRFIDVYRWITNELDEDSGRYRLNHIY